jgi:hypothetical protein
MTLTENQTVLKTKKLKTMNPATEEVLSEYEIVSTDKINESVGKQ